MFVFLSKLLPIFVYPLGLACLLILLALAFSHRRRWRTGLLASALALLWLGGNRWVAMGLARSLEWRYLPPQEIPAAEVVVVMGGGTEAPEFPRPMVELNASGDRLTYAAMLYQQGKARHILVSGGLLDWSSRATTPAQDMAALLEMLGVPQDAIWLQDRSRNTYEDAVYSAQILREKEVQRILLVTSAWHMPRALRLFQAQGLEVVPLPVDFSATISKTNTADLRAFMLNLFPSVDNLATTTRMLKEYIGIFVYDLRGWK